MPGVRRLVAQDLDVLLLKVFDLSFQDLDQPVSLASIVEASKLDEDTAKRGLKALFRKGFVESHLSSGGGYVLLTVKGLEESWRLLDPWYWRWTHSEVMRAAVAATAISTVLSAIVATVLATLINVLMRLF